MDARPYPGSGLSLSQLVFALNEELKRTAYSPHFTFDQVSQLDQDTSTALMTIREWRNSFVPINCVPWDILSLIPTHLISQEDRFRASFVCRHWRRCLLQRAELWSQFSLSKGEVYLKTLLERTKASAINVIVDRMDPVSTAILLPSHTKQIKCLDILPNDWEDIQRFSEAFSGPLPLLHTLTISTTEEQSPGDTNMMAPPSTPLFTNAVNLRAFRFSSKSEWSPSFSQFFFPNLVSFDLSAAPWDEFHALQLLDFLQASPMLRRVHMDIVAHISLKGIPQGRVVLLPNVEEFTLIVNDGRPGYRLAAHLSCPSSRYTSLVYKSEVEAVTPGEIFPASDSWNAIVRQYTRSLVEEVRLEIKPSITCKLVFRSLDAAVVELSFEVLDRSPVDIHDEVFKQATMAIRSHPQLANVKRLHICHSFPSVSPTNVSHIAGSAERFFQHVGPLDELTIHRCDLRPYLHSFLSLSEGCVEEPVVFPPIKELTVSHPLCRSDQQCVAAIVGLAKSHHAREIPFERVVICGETMPVGMEERLRPWVGSVEHRYDKLCKADND
ncbi:hypothetical protein BJ322DRAFT_882676 [Thelephora terrestris]|uniref:F-box domain-containing protein n=1 Tax=Thelephora terrestris TaxID=56493 RepID=A0A9P6HCL8_9AGAM|nr:hypothetical protein BJ322DRAFT_882676 [Thelephora terrestris]